MASGLARLVDAAHSISLQDHSASLSTATRRANFPLPRELRDEIYSYLLDSERLRAPPYLERDRSQQNNYSKNSKRRNSRAHTYQFHPHILGTNHCIHEEATELLYKRNTFVVVSFLWPGLEEAKHIYDVPILCENQNQVARFKSYSLRVHIQHPQKDLGALLKAQGSGVQSFLMLAADLSIFCDVMQWILLTLPSSCEWSSIKDGPPEARSYEIVTCSNRGVKQDYVVRTKLQLRSITTKRMTQELEYALLREFERMIIGRQKVSVISSVRSDTHTRILKETMGPECVWTKAVAWRVLEIADKIKHDNDRLVSTGSLALAAEKHEMQYHITKCMLFRLPKQFYGEDNEIPIGLAVRTVIDSLVTAAFLYIRLRAFNKAENCAGALADMGEVLASLPDHSRILWYGGRYLVCLNAGFWLRGMLHFLNGEYGQAYASMRRVDEETLAHTHFSHDMELVKKWRYNPPRVVRYRGGLEEVQPLQEELLMASSIGQFPAQLFHTPRPAGVTKPLGMEGFIDNSVEAAVKAA